MGVRPSRSSSAVTDGQNRPFDLTRIEWPASCRIDSLRAFTTRSAGIVRQFAPSQSVSPHPQPCCDRRGRPDAHATVASLLSNFRHSGTLRLLLLLGSRPGRSRGELPTHGAQAARVPAYWSCLRLPRPREVGRHGGAPARAGLPRVDLLRSGILGTEFLVTMHPRPMISPLEREKAVNRRDRQAVPADQP